MSGTSRTADVIVIGAGIVGAACAAALARRGLRVLVLEARDAAGGTTGAGMGHLVVMDDSAAQLALTAWSQRLWWTLAPELPPSVEMERCGTLWIAEDDAQLQQVRSKQALYASAGVEAHVLDAQALAEAEPHLRRGLAGALLVPSDGVLYQPVATLALLDAARSYGAVVREGVRVASIGPRSVRTGEGVLQADAIVNAAGADAVRLVPALPILPRKGHLVVTDRHPRLCSHQLVEVGYLHSAHAASGDSVAFNVQPRATGQVLIGSSRQMAGWEPAVDHDIVRRMVARARAFMPVLDVVSIIRIWTGFRPATPDGLPLIGPWASDDPALEGLWIAAGHEGLGIVTALGTAELLADRMIGRTPELDPAPYAPARFAAAPHAT